MSLSDIISKAALGDMPLGSDVAELDAVIARHPWFATARVLRMVASGEHDASLRLHLQSWPCPRVMLRSVSVGERCSLGSRVEQFLTHGEHRITPDEGATDENVASRSENFEIADGMATEALAEIYRAQGLTEQAKKIYEQLSLQNSEKSAYFADQIALCDGAKSEEN